MADKRSHIGFLVCVFDASLSDRLVQAIGFACLLIGISNISGGSLLRLQSGGLMLIGLIALAVFSRLQLTSKKPMLDLRVFKDSSFRIAVVISMAFN